MCSYLPWCKFDGVKGAGEDSQAPGLPPVRAPKESAGRTSAEKVAGVITEHPFSENDGPIVARAMALLRIPCRLGPTCRRIPRPAIPYERAWACAPPASA